jgi:hypothetical protein
MSGSGNIQVRIGFDDEALDRIPEARKQIDSLQSSTRKAAKGIQTMAHSGDAGKLAAGMRGLARESLSAFENMSRVMGPLEVITGAASVAGLARLTSEWAGLTTQLGYSAQRAGVGVTQLGDLQGAATLAGVSAQSMTAGMISLTDGLYSAAKGSVTANAAFNYLHINIRDGNNHLRSAASILPELADKLSAVKNPALQAQLAMQVMGGAGEALLPVLRLGSAGLANYEAQADKLGKTTNRDLKVSQTFTRQQGELTIAMRGLSNTIGEKYAPALGGAEEAMAHFIANNRNGIADAIPAMIVGFGGLAYYLKGPFLKAIRAVLGRDLPDAIKQAAPAVERETAKLGAEMLTGLPTIADILKFLDAPAAAAGILLTPTPAGESTEQAQLRAAIQRMNVERAKAGLPLLPLPQAQPASLSQSVYQQDTASTGLPAGQARANMATAQRYLLSQGWTPAQTAGILANASAESGFNPGQVGDNGTSIGLFQWHNERAAAMQAWAKANGMDPTSLKAQLGYLQYSLTRGSEKAVGAALKATNDPTQAGMLFSEQYERPRGGEAEAYRRGQMATQFLLPVPAPSSSGADGLPSSVTGVLEGLRRVVSPAIMTGLREHQRDTPHHSAIYEKLLASGGDYRLAADNHPGVNGGSGAPTAHTHTVNGKLDANIRLSGAPPGTKTSVQTDGDLFAESGPSKVQVSQVGSGMQP